MRHLIPPCLAGAGCLMVNYGVKKASQVVLGDIALLCMLYSAAAVFCHSISAAWIMPRMSLLLLQLNVVSEVGSAYQILTPSGYQPLVLYTVQNFPSLSFCLFINWSNYL